MRTIQLIISAIADTVIEARGQSPKDDISENSEPKTKGNVDKKISPIQQDLETGDESISEMENDDLPKEEE